jgi:hypothetical protein
MSRSTAIAAASPTRALSGRTAGADGSPADRTAEGPEEAPKDARSGEGSGEGRRPEKSGEARSGDRTGEDGPGGGADSAGIRGDSMGAHWKIQGRRITF